MSHLFLHLARTPESPPSFLPHSEKQVATQRVRSIVAGLPETAFGGIGSDDSGWLAVGVGLRWQNEQCVRLGALDWAEMLAGDLAALDALDGHFAAVRWRGDRLEARTDVLGNRSLYLAKARNGIVVSSRLDWLCRFAGLGDIDWEMLGSHWLAANRFGPGTFVRGMERIAQGGTARATTSSLRTANRAWTPPEAHPNPPRSLESAIVRQLARLPNGTVSLGLSGGLDSRGLVAAMGRAGAAFVLHSFGPEDHPDVVVSQRLAKHLGVPHARYQPRIPEDPERLWEQLRNYAAETVAATPLSAGAKLNVYGALHERGLTVLDGGFGEIARSDYYKRLRLRARRAVLHRDPSGIAPHVRADRGDFFSAEAREALSRGFENDLQQAVGAMPGVDAYSLGDWLDLFAIRTRLPNFAGYAQPFLDGQGVCLTPFVQPSFLRDLFALPPHMRSSAQVKRIIRRAGSPLWKEPLVRGTRFVPFRLPHLATPLYMRFARKSSYVDTTRRDVLARLEPVIRAHIGSMSVRRNAAYDIGRLTHAVERYYDGDASWGASLDWWLALDLWHQGLRAR